MRVAIVAGDNMEIITGAIAEKVGKQLILTGQTICTAESCTGGLIASQISDVAGSSAYFVGGVVSYSNNAKQEILGVSELTIESHGAVSEETVIEMALGVRGLFHADMAVSISGIMGPGGGTEEKPVGTVWICVTDSDGSAAKKHLFSGDRIENKFSAAQAALGMVSERLSSKG